MKNISGYDKKHRKYKIGIKRKLIYSIHCMRSLGSNNSYKETRTLKKPSLNLTQQSQFNLIIQKVVYWVNFRHNATAKS